MVVDLIVDDSRVSLLSSSCASRELKSPVFSFRFNTSSLSFVDLISSARKDLNVSFCLIDRVICVHLLAPFSAGIRARPAQIDNFLEHIKPEGSALGSGTGSDQDAKESLGNICGIQQWDFGCNAVIAANDRDAKELARLGK